MRLAERHRVGANVGDYRAFIAASDACGSLGSSLWEYGETKPSQWRLLASL